MISVGCQQRAKSGAFHFQIKIICIIKGHCGPDWDFRKWWKWCNLFAIHDVTHSQGQKAKNTVRAKRVCS